MRSASRPPGNSTDRSGNRGVWASMAGSAGLVGQALAQQRQHGLGRLATGLDRPAPGREVGAADTVQPRPDHDIGVTQLEGVDAAAHDRKGLHQHPEGVAGRVFLGRRADVHRDHQLGAHVTRETHRHRRHEATVHILALADAHRLEHRRHRAGGAHRGAGVAAAEQDRGAVGQVGGDDAQWQGHLLDRLAGGLVADEARQRLAADQSPQREGPVGDRPFVHRLGQRLHLLAALAGGIQRGHQAAGRGAGHQVDLDAAFLQHLDHADVGETARGAAAECQADAWRLGRRLDDGRRVDRRRVDHRRLGRLRWLSRQHRTAGQQHSEDDGGGRARRAADGGSSHVRRGWRPHAASKPPRTITQA
mmetsp:Transcript_10639/g.43607  ORF Transcript_10639/g.43607 Transcript_10639/m.43607 type:complete len:362 (+) Transcript_10639:2527-3612(+)